MNPRPNIQVVWFKRDLRVADHAPLYQSSQKGRCLCLYIYEPELMQSAEYDSSHHLFINEALAELAGNLEALGSPLITRLGRIPDEFERLYREMPFTDLWSHEETGNDITYQRDKRVAQWCRNRNVTWHEPWQTGVVRRLKTRDGWATRWEKRMNQPLVSVPERIIPPDQIPKSMGILPCSAVGLPPMTKRSVQKGGESIARETLNSFLQDRGEKYQREMSSPVTGETRCSRISTYLAWGCISIRTVHQTVKRQVSHLRDITQQIRAIGKPIPRSQWAASLRSFSARLRWHCHFMQKLEDEPELEFQNLCRAYDGMRENDFRDDYFQAWCAGKTGYPMVDACMRAVLETGWINFRMRAMLISFASYHLWLHWRYTGPFLGRHFLDFEPGIHYPQVQMQSGTTGINTLRIYSPTKQALDQDPTGIFIRRFIPELAQVPLIYLAEPSRMPLSIQREAGCLIGRDYPTPLVDHATAYRRAKDRVTVVRKQYSTWQEAHRVYLKHGSRKEPMPAFNGEKSASLGAKTRPEFEQMTLF